MSYKIPKIWPDAAVKGFPREGQSMTAVNDLVMEAGINPRQRAHPGIKISLTENVVSCIIAVVDFFMIVSPALFAYFIYVFSGHLDQMYLIALLVQASLTIGIAWNAGGYVNSSNILKESSTWTLIRAFVLAAGFTLVLGFGLKVSAHYSRLWVGAWLLTSLVCLVAGRFLISTVVARMPDLMVRRVAVLGAGEQAQRLIRQMKLADHYKVIGIFDDRRTRAPAEIEGIQVVGGIEQLIMAVRSGKIDDVILTLPWSAAGRIDEILTKLSMLPVNVRIGPDLINFHLADRRLTMMGGVPAIHALERPISGWSYIAKSLVDRVLSLVLMVLLSPLFLLISVIIRIESPGPVLFVQERFGFNDHVFRVYKFRTMYHHRRDPEARQQTVRDDPRVTRFGSILRKTSLDELPQLFNVLVGDMSLVGPRPHALGMTAEGQSLNDAVARYAARHRVKPGITGWAQINGCRGNADSVEKINRRIECDLWYIDHWSLSLDIWILVKTLMSLRDRNAY